MKFENVVPKKESLSQLFYADTKYIIPAYQRPYEWKSEQIENLLDNLYESFESHEDSIYILGTVQFNILKNGDKEIIDGHQRLTTLYLIKKYLGQTPCFKYKNEINSSESIDELLEKEKNSPIEGKKQYKDNYNYIETYFSKGERSKIDKDKFGEFLDNNVVFISISIEDCSSIDDTLKIFDTLNTTGLSLQVKDIFKIKFSDYISKKDNSVDKAEVIRKINEAYDNVINPLSHVDGESVHKYDSVYNLDESDLLDAYRFYLISQMKKHKWATEFKQSNSAFFEVAFKDEKDDINISLNDFCELSKCIKETQNALRRRDFVDCCNVNDIVLGCSKELLDWSGYSRIKNLYYFVAFIVYKNHNNTIDENVIKITDSVINCVWRYCSIFRFVRAKVVNDAFNNVGDALFDNIKYLNTDICSYDIKIEKSLFDSFRDYISKNYYERFEGFKALLKPNGNVFQCNLPHLLMFLSYIEDSFKIGEKKIINTRGKIGHWILEKGSLDIEHILSHDLYTDEEYVNSIGNLMYLPKYINRALGVRLAKYNQEPDARERDFLNKIKWYDEKIGFIKEIYKYNELFVSE